MQTLCEIIDAKSISCKIIFYRVDLNQESCFVVKVE